MKLTLSEIYQYLQRIDGQIISLLEKRNELMEMAEDVVLSEDDSIGDIREEIIINNIRNCSMKHKINHQVIDEIYKVIIKQYINKNLDAINN